MECEVKYFGMIGEKLGLTSEKIELVLPNSDLKKVFIERYPSLEKMTFKIAVDGVLTNSISGIDAKTIALLPPFAGG